MIIQKMIADIVLLEDIPSISNAIHMVPANHIPCELVLVVLIFCLQIGQDGCLLVR